MTKPPSNSTNQNNQNAPNNKGNLFGQARDVTINHVQPNYSILLILIPILGVIIAIVMIVMSDYYLVRAKECDSASNIKFALWFRILLGQRDFPNVVFCNQIFRDHEKVLTVYGLRPITREFDLSGLNFENANFKDSEMSNVNFGTEPSGIQTNLIKAKFINVVLAGAKFNNANLKDSHFEMPLLCKDDPRNNSSDCKGSLESADFTGADLTRTDFTGAYLGNAKFDGANLTGANFSSALELDINQIYKAKTICKTTLPNNKIDNRDCPLGR